MSVELDDPAPTAASSAPTTARSTASSRPSTPSRSPTRSSPSARSPPAPSPSTPRPSRPRSSASPTTTTPASTTSATSCRCCAPTACSIAAYVCPDPAANLGVNHRADLALAAAEARRRIAERHMLAGVTIVDPAATWIDADVEIGADATIEPGLRPARRDRDRCGAVGPHTTLIDSTLGADVTAHSYLVDAEVGDELLGRPLRLPPARHQARRRRQGRHLRRDQELRDRRGHQGPAPLLRRRRRRRRRLEPGRRHDHRQLRRVHQEPHEDRGTCANRRRHRLRRAGRGRRRRIHWRRSRDPRGRPAGRARGHHRANSATSRASQSARGQSRKPKRKATRGRTRMSVVEETPQMVSSIPQDYTKRLMVFGGRASMELAARIAGHLDVDLGTADLRTFADGEVYARYEESIRGADVFLVQSTAANEAHGMTPERRPDGAAGDDRRRAGRLRPPDHRRDALVRLRPPGQEVPAARADHRPRRRQVPRGRRRRPRPHHGPPLRPGAGLLRGPGRPHDRDAEPHPVLHRPGLRRRARDRLARRRPREGRPQLRPQARAPTGP